LTHDLFIQKGTAPVDDEFWTFLKIIIKSKMNYGYTTIIINPDNPDNPDNGYTPTKLGMIDSHTPLWTFLLTNGFNTGPMSFQPVRVTLWMENPLFHNPF
jgi:hypothetical protein